MLTKKFYNSDGAKQEKLPSETVRCMKTKGRVVRKVRNRLGLLAGGVEGAGCVKVREASWERGRLARSLVFPFADLRRKAGGTPALPGSLPHYKERRWLAAEAAEPDIERQEGPR